MELPVYPIYGTEKASAKFQNVLFSCATKPEDWSRGFICSTQLSTKFILLINVNVPTIVGVLTFINMRDLKQDTSLFVGILVL